MEANSDNDLTVRNNPSVLQLDITRVNSVGLSYRIKVQASNEAGYVISPILGVILGSPPL